MALDIWSKLKNFIGPTPWKISWQQELSEILQKAQKNLNVNMIVVIARESDLYAELLFLLCFVGLSVGSGMAYLFGSIVEKPIDMLIFPLSGFSLGACLFHFKRFFLRRFAPRAVRDRVNFRAKAVFFDHSQQMNGPMVLLYVSEIENEALFLSDADLLQKISNQELQFILSELVDSYHFKAPLVSLRPALIQLGELLRKSLGTGQGTRSQPPIFLGPTDMNPGLPPVRVLKGSQDIN